MLKWWLLALGLAGVVLGLYRWSADKPVQQLSTPGGQLLIDELRFGKIVSGPDRVAAVVFTAPGSNGQRLCELQPGTEVHLDDRAGAWLHVEFSLGEVPKSGWVEQSQVHFYK